MRRCLKRNRNKFAAIAHNVREVMNVKEVYSDLHGLLGADKAAHAYFMQQPEHVQGAILEKAASIQSMRELEEAVRTAKR